MIKHSKILDYFRCNSTNSKLFQSTQQLECLFPARVGREQGGGGSRVEDGPGIPRVFYVFCGREGGVRVWQRGREREREREKERGREQGYRSGGRKRELGRKVDIENQDLLGAGVPGHTRMGGSFSLFFVVFTVFWWEESARVAPVEKLGKGY